MICILLVEMGLFKTATESLDYFAQRRTDTSISDRFQGVETASQIRYVKYFEQIFLMPDLKYPKQTWEVFNSPVSHLNLCFSVAICRNC